MKTPQCPSCGSAAKQRDENRSETIRREVRRIRMTLGLTQKQDAEIFGGGVNAFSRYGGARSNPDRCCTC